MTMMTAQTSPAGPVFFSHAKLACPGIRHGFFTRQGGVSTGLYDSLNCGLGSDDTKADVSENRARVAAAMGLAPEKMAGLYQVHSARCVTLTDPHDCSHRPEADAYVTALSGVGLAILTADCLPVLFCCPQAGVIGAAHAGWRGAVAGVIEATVAAMQGLGARTDQIIGVIGPGIQQASYQVSSEMREEIISRYETAAACFAPDPQMTEKYLFDLPGFAVSRARAAGLSQIYDCGQDTYSNDTHFFSHRRATHKGEPDSGRLISVIAQI